ncbi:hypothetical protein NBRC116588_04540 [Pyruvatibacter sp. HU-CL02332]|uniref:GIY-YIG nuclease family protein n=1 Tax=Pyruvatibacter sp. HU-CL02332 TaxID=3127650 RepID=UPI00310701D9
MTHYKEFEFDLPEALLERLVNSFEEMDGGPLLSETVADVPNEQGVYQLFLDNQLVYIGKTDADAGLNRRLARHAKKILHRRNLTPSRVSFKAIRVFVFTAMDLESDLIRHYGGTRNVAWNGSGFGSNDPGRRRDTSAVKDNHYDWQFPINIDEEIDFELEPGGSVEDALSRLRLALPYVLRYETQEGGRAAHSELQQATLDPSAGTTSCRLIVEQALSKLPSGWQATALPGYVIIYREDRHYDRAEVISKS